MLGKSQGGVMALVIEHGGLEKEYLTVLRLWSESRALYPPNSPVVIQLMDQMEELEARLKQAHRN